MPSAKSTADMLEVARLFYENELPKQRIAKKMGFDARTVTAVLKRARETGMVKIYVHNPADGPAPDFPRGRQYEQMIFPFKPVF
jgi:DNA-binding transcriptional regulator LsrR (DeoR family)